MLQGPDPKAAPRLYTAIEPYQRFHLPVGDGHELNVELCGTPGASAVTLPSAGARTASVEGPRLSVVKVSEYSAGRRSHVAMRSKARSISPCVVGYE